MKSPGLICLFMAVVVAQVESASAAPASRWRVFTQADGLAETAVASVTLSAGGEVLVGHPEAAAISVFDGYEVRQIPAPPGDRRRVYASPGGQFWTVAYEGLLELRDPEWKLRPVPDVTGHFRSGRTNEIILLPVRQGHVLILLPDRLLQFTAEGPDTGRLELLQRAAQTTLGDFTSLTLARDGVLWLSGTRGVARSSGPARNLKPDEAWVMSESLPPELLAPGTWPGITHDLPVSQVLGIAVEPGGATWLATADGLFRRGPEIWEPVPRGRELPQETAGAVTRIQPGMAVPAGGPPDSTTIWLTSFIARNGDVWLGATNEIAWQRRGVWQVFASTNQIGPEQVIGFVETPDGRICCATPDKVWEFDGRSWLPLRGGFDQVHAFICARDGTLWVATETGLHRHVRGAWVQNDVTEGLPSSVVTAVQEDVAGEILVTTPAGVGEWQRAADEDAPRTFILPLTEMEAEFREGTAVRLEFGGRDKWNATLPSRLLFSHRLDDREWSPFMENNEVTLTDLAAGKHVFQVRAMDRNANVDPRPARLEFAVVEPWYRETRLVFILAVALAVALFFAALAFNRHRRLQSSYAEVERQIAQRTRELELANRELLHSQKMNALGTLAAGIAHDFNNILSIVKGSAQIIEENLEHPEKVRTRLERIKTVVHQGAGIVEAMLGFSRGNRTAGELCDINRVVEATVTLLGDRFLREIDVQFQRADQLPEIAVPRDFVQQVLLNFILNAREAMERVNPSSPGGADAARAAAGAASGRKRITLATRLVETLPADLVLAPARAEGYIAIAVEDTGCGIPAEILPRIFEPFFTTKSFSARRGTGLGLSMVYELAKKMGAGLTVATIVGAGSTFTLFLPVQSVPADSHPPVETSA